MNELENALSKIAELEGKIKTLESDWKRLLNAPTSTDILKALDGMGWAQGLEQRVLYKRREDDSARGYISVMFAGDGDAWLGIHPDPAASALCLCS